MPPSHRGLHQRVAFRIHPVQTSEEESVEQPWGWSVFPDALSNMASGALPYPETSGGWMPSLHPV